MGPGEWTEAVYTREVEIRNGKNKERRRGRFRKEDPTEVTVKGERKSRMGLEKLKTTGILSWCQLVPYQRKTSFVQPKQTYKWPNRWTTVYKTGGRQTVQDKIYDLYLTICSTFSGTEEPQIQDPSLCLVQELPFLRRIIQKHEGLR